MYLAKKVQHNFVTCRNMKKEVSFILWTNIHTQNFPKNLRFLPADKFFGKYSVRTK